MKTCATCKFFDAVGNDAVCIESPPTFYLQPTPEGMARSSSYPPIGSHTIACGRYKLKPKSRKRTEQLEHGA